ncbi:MAG: MBL fold metallo-hydrolase [Clostridia bacterium]|nr:MBL fold metallo-hydrolase [Clostridia bacterium]
MKRVLLILFLISALLLSGCSYVDNGKTTDNGKENTDPASEGYPSDIAVWESGIKVIFFDVGKGDAIAIRTENSTVLIDCGYTGSGQGIADALINAGVKKIDKLIITHFDKDHVGGAGLIIRYFEIGEVIFSSYSQDNEESKAFRMAMSLKGTEGYIPKDNYSFELDGVVYYVYPPSADGYSENVYNNASIVVKAVYKEKSFLFTADIDEERVEEILKSKDDFSCDVLKAPYHGNNFSALGDFFKMTGAQYAVVTSSDSQAEAAKTLKKLSKAGMVYYLTRNGSVIVSSDGKSLTISQTK